MRIAVTNNGKKVAEKLDKTINFTIFDMIKSKGKTALNVSASGGDDAMFFILKNEGVNVLLCGEISEHIRMQLEKYGIEVIAGLQGNVKTLLKAYSTGKIRADRVL